MREKTVLVTGGTSGIGLSIGVYLKYLGYKTYITSRNPENYSSEGLKQTFLEQNNNKIPKKIRNNLDEIIDEIILIKLDIEDSQSIDECVSQIQSKSEVIDVLINNVGFSNFSSIEENPHSVIDSMFNTNVIGPIKLIQAVLPKMREFNSGRIINITSMAGYQALPFMGIYAATKSAMMRLSEALRLECSQFDIKISSLVLGTFNTKFNSNMLSMNNSNSKKSGDKLDTKNLVAPNSPYSTLARKVWDFTDRFFSSGSNPIKAAKKTAKILKKENPKIHYNYGKFDESVLNTLRKYGSTQFFLNLLDWMFSN